MENEREQLPRATKELAERLDYVIAERARLRESDDADATTQFFSMCREYDKLTDNYDWNDEVFEENGKKGLRNVKGEVVVPAIYDDFLMLEPYYYKSHPVGAVLGDMAGLVARDGTGTPVTEFEYCLVAPIFMTPFHAVWKAEYGRYFALMVADKVITPYEIEEFDIPCDGVLPLYADGKKGMLAYDLGLIYIKPEYDDIHGGGIGEDFIFVKDGKKGRVTLDKRFVSDEEFSNLSEEEQDELCDEGFISSPYL